MRKVVVFSDLNPDPGILEAIGPRAIFSNNLEHYNTSFYYNANRSVNLPQLLRGTLEGKVLVNLDKTVPLNNPARQNLVRVIGKHILKDNPRKIVRTSTYAEWAHAITLVFPKEKPSVYFHTKLVESPRGVLTRLAGKLPDQIHNLKRKYRDTGVAVKHRQTSLDTLRSSVGIRLPDGLNDEEDAEENILWLKNSSEPWAAVEEKWAATTQTRLNLSKELSISDYFRQYPALKNPKGYRLLEKDFELLYAGKYTEITESLPKLKENIFKLAQKRRKNSKDIDLDLLVNYQDGSEETSTIASLLLIPSLLSVTSVRLKNSTKKIWRLSKSEARDGLITHVKTDSDVRSTVTNKRSKICELGLTVQPFIIIVGESLEDIKTYFVVIDEVFYAVPNILSAVSLCFKLNWVVNAQYPIESHSTWMFIQNALFKFKTRFDSSSTAAHTLMAELGVEG